METKYLDKRCRRCKCMKNKEEDFYFQRHVCKDCIKDEVTKKQRIREIKKKQAGSSERLVGWNGHDEIYI